ncbi:MAG: ATP-binding cassette domain-containing protein [Alphaproteobacteria bacterium]|nr:ATP-binding cassette domain-containing protein [Alphaproteobacteria bacterium]
MRETLLEVSDLRVHFPVRGQGLFARPRPLRAVDGVSFTVHAGETLGIVGESGSGKSTIARAILRLNTPTGGRVVWLGTDIARLSEHALRPLRRDLQIIFQDPLASLDPRMTVGDIVAEPLTVAEPELTREARRERVAAMLDLVGLSPQMVNRYPHEFSGGQCQRIGIARAMVVRPRLVLCDEAVSSLDVSIQAQIINLLKRLQREMGLSLIFISHDLSVVRHISDRILVLYLGRVMELGPAERVIGLAHHPYTAALISAVPVPDPAVERGRPRLLLEGEIPSPLDPPSGCVFRTRCPKAQARCAAEVPALVPRGTDEAHLAACHFPNI